MTTPQSNPPRPDPLIDEVRAIRTDISNRFGNDVRKLGEYLREIERQYKDRLKSAPPKDKPPPPDPAAQ
jgi:hypothetical protein